MSPFIHWNGLGDTEIVYNTTYTDTSKWRDIRGLIRNFMYFLFIWKRMLLFVYTIPFTVGYNMSVPIFFSVFKTILECIFCTALSLLSNFGFMFSTVEKHCPFVVLFITWMRKDRIGTYLVNMVILGIIGCYFCLKFLNKQWSVSWYIIRVHFP